MATRYGMAWHGLLYCGLQAAWCAAYRVYRRLYWVFGDLVSRVSTACCMYHAASCVLHVDLGCCVMRDACCVLRNACCMLYVARCILHVVRCMSDVVRCVLCVACCMVNVACCMLHATYVACYMLHVYVACCTACRLSSLLSSGLPARERLLEYQSRVRHTPIGPFYSLPLPPPARPPPLPPACTRATHMKHKCSCWFAQRS